MTLHWWIVGAFGVALALVGFFAIREPQPGPHDHDHDALAKERENWKRATDHFERMWLASSRDVALRTRELELVKRRLARARRKIVRMHQALKPKEKR